MSRSVTNVSAGPLRGLSARIVSHIENNQGVNNLYFHGR